MFRLHSSGVNVHRSILCIQNPLKFNIFVDTSLYWRTRACAAGPHCTGLGPGGHLTQMKFCCWDNEAIEVLSHCLVSVFNVFNKCLVSVFVPFSVVVFSAILSALYMRLFNSRKQTKKIKTHSLFSNGRVFYKNMSLQSMTSL